MIIGPALQARAVEVAASTVSLEMRRTRQLSVDTRHKYRVTFTAPNTITTEKQATVAEGGTWSQVREVDLPDEMEFNIDNDVTAGPENFATSAAVNFTGASVIYFMPDGSAIAGNGLISSGVVYVSRPGEVDTTRAITLFGTTGRTKQWEYVQTEGSWE